MITMDALRAMLRSSVGVDDTVDLEGPISDTSFGDLGYDSLALLELAGQLRRQYGVDVPEEAVDESATPAQLVELVNKAIGDLETSGS